MEVIEERLAETEGDWLFPGASGGPVKRHGMRMAHIAACERAEITGYTIHDNRHSFARHCDLMKIPRLIWDPVLGHGGGSMADLYSGHDFAEQRLDCMERWSSRIAVAAAGGNVVELDQVRDKPA